MMTFNLKDVTHKITRLINKVILNKPSNLVLEERIETILIQFKDEIKKEILIDLRKDFNKRKK